VSAAFLPALEQARLVRERQVSPLELVEEYLARIERFDPELNAYVTVCADEAQAAAEVAHEGPFAGVPMPIKDLVQTAGIRTTFSCKAFADNVPEQDAELARRIRAAGFIVLGKTNTPEFGSIPVTESDLNGACRNPWDPSRTPGGSSGGAAAAVAAGLAPVAQGSDGGGSIRIPSSCCGLFGLKPSRGRTTTAPLGDAYGLSVQGPIARTVTDAAAYLDALAGPEPGDPYVAPPPERPFLDEVGAPPGRLRVALVLEPPVRVDVDPACADAARDAAKLLEQLGHDVEEVPLAWNGEGLGELFARVWQTIPAQYPSADRSQLERLNAEFAARADATSSSEYVRAYVQLQTYGRRVAEFCAGYDLVLTPTLARPPVPIGWVREPADPWEQYERALAFTPFTPAVNVAGLPAASVPFAWTDDGLPVGVQLIASFCGEDVLLRVSAQIEEARPWADRRPPLAQVGATEPAPTSIE
jgi:amidase